MLSCTVLTEVIIFLFVFDEFLFRNSFQNLSDIDSVVVNSSNLSHQDLSVKGT